MKKKTRAAKAALAGVALVGAALSENAEAFFISGGGTSAKVANGKGALPAKGSVNVLTLPEGFKFDSKRGSDGFPRVIEVRPSAGGRARIDGLNTQVRQIPGLKGPSGGRLDQFLGKGGAAGIGPGGGGPPGMNGNAASTESDCTENVCTL